MGRDRRVKELWEGFWAPAVQVLAAALLLVLLWRLFRLAMGLWVAMRDRQDARHAEERDGRRVVAEIPASDGLLFFVDDGDAFRWADATAPKVDILGARLLLNGAVVGTAARDGSSLSPPPVAEPQDGRERWEVQLYVRDGRTLTVSCGTLREGVSREIATRVFEAVRAGVG